MTMATTISGPTVGDVVRLRMELAATRRELAAAMVELEGLHESVVRALSAELDATRRTLAETREYIMTARRRLEFASRWAVGVRPAAVPAEACLMVIETLYGVERDKLMGRGRPKEIIEARRVLYALLCRDAGLSSKTAGIFLNGRHHSTILYGANNVPDDHPGLIEARRLLREQAGGEQADAAKG